MLVAVDLGLPFPVALVESLDKLLHLGKACGLAESGDFIFEAVGQPLIVLAEECNFIPASLERMSVEL